MFEPYLDYTLDTLVKVFLTLNLSKITKLTKPLFVMNVQNTVPPYSTSIFSTTAKTCVRQPPLKLTLVVDVERWLSYKGTCHVILLAKLHDMYLYKAHNFFHINHYLKSVSKVALLHRFYCMCPLFCNYLFLISPSFGASGGCASCLWHFLGIIPYTF